MLQVAFIKENKEKVIERLAVKHFNDIETIEKILSLDDNRKEVKGKIDNLKAESNKIAKEIGDLFKSGKKDEAESLKQSSGEIKEKVKDLEVEFNSTVNELNTLLLNVPNVPNELVPEGSSEEHNEVVYEWGEIPDLPENPLPHWELADKYEIIDFELGNKLAGAGFPVYRGAGAKLQRALINFFLDSASEAGYTECQPPVFVNEASATATGQLPDKEGQMYKMENEDLYAIPTAEVPVTNIFRDCILKKDDFPIKYTAYTPCFRREAGSYGKDVRGLNRLHQFDKVEIVQICNPEKSYAILEEMKEYVSGLLTKLNLQFRIVRLCGGDLGFTSALTYDFEVYSAAQERWLEVSSVSNFENYQANRLKLRYKDDSGQTILAHTLNGSALALPRIVAALLENNQSKESIVIPEVLRTYTGFDEIRKFTH